MILRSDSFFTLLSLYEPNSARNYAALAACQKMIKAYEKAISNYAVALLLDPAHIEYILLNVKSPLYAQLAR